MVPSGEVKPTKPVPTGVPRSSLFGPAQPVTDTAMSLPQTRLAPSAMAAAVWALTAPNSSRVSWGTPSTWCFT